MRRVENALRGVVREALEEVAETGLGGDHHFYLTFRTRAPGVQIPDYLSSQYPDEMTIVLQHQFYGLEVAEDRFSVSLSFAGKMERLTVPLGAISTFADPAINFALQFQTLHPGEGSETLGERAVVTSQAQAEEGEEGEEPEASPQSEPAKVVTLDQFRKK